MTTKDNHLFQVDYQSVKTYSRFIFHFAWLMHEQNVPRSAAEKVLAQASHCFIEAVFQKSLEGSGELTDLHQRAMQEAIARYWGEKEGDTL